MTQQENDMYTDVALIKRDIQQIEKIVNKVDGALNQMSEISKILAVQEKILENNGKRMDGIEDKFVRYSENELEYKKELNQHLEDIKSQSQIERERRHKEVMSSIEKMSNSLNAKLDTQDKRITTLENWRWYIAGAMGVALFAAKFIPWPSLFGN